MKIQIHNRHFLIIGSAISIIFLFALVFKTAANSQENERADQERTALHLVKVKPNGYIAKPMSPEAAEGQKLFTDLNCTACHSIHNTGGCLGPLLDGVGGRRTSDYIQSKITNTQAAKEHYDKLIESQRGELFPHVRISKKSADLISAFLLTLPEPPGGYIVQGHGKLPADESVLNLAYKAALQTADSEEGKQLYSKFGCVACHSIDNVGGWLGPKMDGIGGRRNRQYIVAHITNARAHLAKINGSDSEIVSQMPRFTATSDEIQKIATFLETLPNPQK